MPNASVSFAIFMANYSLAQFFHPLGHTPCSMGGHVQYVSAGAIMCVSQPFPQTNGCHCCSTAENPSSVVMSTLVGTKLCSCSRLPYCFFIYLFEIWSPAVIKRAKRGKLKGMKRNPGDNASCLYCLESSSSPRHNLEI